MTTRQKQDFLAAMRRFIDHDGKQTPDGHGRPDRRPCRGEVTLVRGLHALLRDDTPNPTNYDGCVWAAHLDHYLVDAFASLRTGEDYAVIRSAYEAETGYEIPDITERHGSTPSALHRLLVGQSIVGLCCVLASEADCGGEWLRVKLERTLFAQDDAVDLAWLGFVRVGYREIMPRTRGEAHRTNIGVFGDTALTTFACAGRVVFAFSRGDDHAEYVADDSDMHGRRAGPNTTETRYDRVVSMIEEVTRLWSLEAMKPKAVAA